MYDEMQRQVRSEILAKFGKEQAQRLGLIAADSVPRLDAREVRHEAEGTMRDDNLRIPRLDDNLSQERLDVEERIATQYLHTDGERAEALKKLERDRKESAWLEDFTRKRLARENDERRDSSTSEDESLKRLNHRLANQWRGTE